MTQPTVPALRKPARNYFMVAGILGFSKIIKNLSPDAQSERINQWIELIVQLRSSALKPLSDEPALKVELGLGDLPRHEQPDGAVLFHLDAQHILLGLGDLRLQSAAALSIKGVNAGSAASKNSMESSSTTRRQTFS